MALPMDVSSMEHDTQREETAAGMDRWLSGDARSPTQYPDDSGQNKPAAAVAETALSILGELEQAVVLLGRSGLIWYQNESARRLLAEQPGLGSQDGILTCTSAVDQESLNDLIAALPWSADDDASVTRVMRLGKGLSALILVGRVIAPPVNGASRVGLIVVHRVEEPEVRHAPALLREAFSLTRAEAAVATMIAGGNTPAEIASHRNVSVETIRAQLRVLYSKTGTNRQAGLVRLVNRLTLLG